MIYYSNRNEVKMSPYGRPFKASRMNKFLEAYCFDFLFAESAVLKLNKPPLFEIVNNIL